VPNPLVAAGASAGGGAEEKKREKSPGGAEGGVWSIASESHPLPLLAVLAGADADAPGKEEAGLAFSHAARVLASTGHTSAGAEDSGALDMSA